MAHAQEAQRQEQEQEEGSSCRKNAQLLLQQLQEKEGARRLVG